MPKCIPVGLAFVAFAVAGCGSMSQSASQDVSSLPGQAYQHRVNSAQQAVESQIITYAQAATQATTKAAGEKQLWNLAWALRQASAKLGAIKPPQGYGQLHAQYVTEISSAASITGAAARGNFAQFGLEIKQTQQEMSVTLAAINKKIDAEVDNYNANQ